MSLLFRALGDKVQSTAGSKPVDLINRHGVLGGDAQDFTGRLGDLERDLSLDVAVQQFRQVFRLDSVHGGNLLVVCLVFEPDRQEALLF